MKATQIGLAAGLFLCAFEASANPYRFIADACQGWGRAGLPHRLIVLITKEFVKASFEASYSRVLLFAYQQQQP
jgi:hypothetical protein